MPTYNIYQYVICTVHYDICCNKHNIEDAVLRIILILMELCRTKELVVCSMIQSRGFWDQHSYNEIAMGFQFPPVEILLTIVIQAAT